MKRTQPKKIGVILAGGTISGRSDRAGQVVHGSGKLVRQALDRSSLALKGQLNLCNIIEVYDRLSEEIGVAEWTRIANVVHKLVMDSVNGIIITHGTDTMEYTASALSLALPGLRIPVCLTGALFPLDRPESDAACNLDDALVCAARTDLSGVYVVFGGTIHPGTHVTKRRVESTVRGAAALFATVNRPDVGQVINSRFHRLSNANVVSPPTDTESELRSAFDSTAEILEITLRPQLNVGELLQRLNSRTKAVLLLGYGTGTGNSGQNPDTSIANFIAKVRYHGIPVFLSSQHWGVVDPKGYETTVALIDAGAIPLFDMTPAMAWVKLLWVLENPERTNQPSTIVERMLTNVAGEIRSIPGDEIKLLASRYP